MADPTVASFRDPELAKRLLNESDERIEDVSYRYAFDKRPVMKYKNKRIGTVMSVSRDGHIMIEFDRPNYIRFVSSKDKNLISVE